MISEAIEGWRISLEGQALEISGPGNLKIEIPHFVLSGVVVEGFVNLERDPPLYCKLGFSYFEVSGKCNIYLDYYFTGEPEAYLIVGCAHWVVPRRFAERLVHVFLMGDTSQRLC